MTVYLTLDPAGQDRQTEMRLTINPIFYVILCSES
jgi:hypothetical protein